MYTLHIRRWPALNSDHTRNSSLWLVCGCGCAKTIEFRYCVSLSLSPSTFSVFQKVLQCKKKQKDPRTNTNEFEECKQKRIYISIRVCHTSKRIKLITHIENAASAIYEWLWFKVVHFDMLSEKNSFHFVVFFLRRICFCHEFLLMLSRVHEIKKTYHDDIIIFQTTNFTCVQIWNVNR